MFNCLHDFAFSYLISKTNLHKSYFLCDRKRKVKRFLEKGIGSIYFGQAFGFIVRGLKSGRFAVFGRGFAGEFFKCCIK